MRPRGTIEDVVLTFSTQGVNFSHKQAAKLLGRVKLEELMINGSIRWEQTGTATNSKIVCNGSDVIANIVFLPRMDPAKKAREKAKRQAKTNTKTRTKAKPATT